MTARKCNKAIRQIKELWKANREEWLAIEAQCPNYTIYRAWELLLTGETRLAAACLMSTYSNEDVKGLKTTILSARQPWDLIQETNGARYFVHRAQEALIMHSLRHKALMYLVIYEALTC